MENNLSPTNKSRLSVWVNPKTYADILERAWNSFPFTVCYIFLLGIAIGCWNYIDRTSLPQSIVAGLTPGTLLSVIAQQWNRYLSLKKGLALQLCGIAFTIAAIFYIDSLGQRWTSEFSAGYLSVLIFLAVAILVAPVSKEMCSNEKRYFYTRQLVIRLNVTVAAFLFMSLITSLFSFTLNALFDLSYHEIFALLFPLFAVIPPAIYFIAGYPTEISAMDSFIAPGALFDRFCKNILLPLAAIYAVILYVYGAKMLFELSLPRTSVSLMVGGLVVSVFVLLFGIQVYGFARADNLKASTITDTSFRWWPVVMIPLLIMMTAAIGYRVWQYGWTAPRLYVALFNLVAYAACIYGLCRKSPRMDLIASSFVGLVLLASIIPGLNFTSLSARRLSDKIAEDLKKIGISELPVSYEKLCIKLQGIPSKEAHSISEDIILLQSELGPDAISPIVSGNVPHYEYEILNDIQLSVDYKSKEFWTKSKEMKVLSPIPQGFSSIEYVSTAATPDNTTYLGKDSIKIQIDSVLTLTIGLNRLVKTEGKASALPITYQVASAPGDVFILTHFQLYSSKEITKEDDFGTFRFSGYYLKK